MTVELTVRNALLALDRTPGLVHHAPAVDGSRPLSSSSFLELIRRVLSTAIILLLLLQETR